MIVASVGKLIISKLCFVESLHISSQAFPNFLFFPHKAGGILHLFFLDRKVVRKPLAKSSKQAIDLSGRLSNQCCAALVRVVGKALQRVASEAPAKYIRLQKLLRSCLGSVDPSYKAISGFLKFLGTSACMISSENGSPVVNSRSGCVGIVLPVSFLFNSSSNLFNFSSVSFLQAYSLCSWHFYALSLFLECESEGCEAEGCEIEVDGGCVDLGSDGEKSSSHDSYESAEDKAYKPPPEGYELSSDSDSAIRKTVAKKTWRNVILTPTKKDSPKKNGKKTPTKKNTGGLGLDDEQPVGSGRQSNKKGSIKYAGRRKQKSRPNFGPSSSSSGPSSSGS
ncbi:hypothetical protein PIB30_075012 [Stylosanthes scabra]|uniref:Uncharacterized protein n=1 Tax=Stylosanthes scabra TaxID=79078 RepID=A0ABU6QPY8_9FABA|nr:hypothetical protein [Stylosanthes scabra]